MGTIILRKIVGFIFAYYSSLLRVTALFVNALRESNDSRKEKRGSESEPLENGGEFSRSLISSHRSYGWRSLSKPYTDGFFIYYPTFVGE